METWVPIHGLFAYEVSNLGNIKRTAHIGFHKRYGDRKFPERMLKPAKNHDGYLRLNIGNKHRFVHVIVLESFVGLRPEGMQACHNNGKPDDNRLENLRWDTPRNNVQDRRKHGTYQNGEKNHQFKYSAELRKLIVESTEPAQVLADRLKISRSAIYSIKFRHRQNVCRVVDIS